MKVELLLASATSFALEAVSAKHVLVVGTGPGGTGFVRRLLERCPTCKITWFEEGRDTQVLDWPATYSNIPDDQLRRVKRTHSVTGSARFIMLGGGASGNSGGPTAIFDSRDLAMQTSVDKYGPNLLEEEICSPCNIDPAAEKWLENYAADGYTRVGPFLSDRRNQSHAVGYGATTFCNGGRRSMTRETAKDPRVMLRTETKVEHVLFDENKTATEVLLVDGSTVAGDYVVLSGGVYGSFELLVKSGIGKKEDMANVRQPKQKEPVHVNDNVGEGVGDDSGVLYIHEGQSSSASHAADVISQNGNEFSVEHWGLIGLDSLALGFPYIKTSAFLRSTVRYLMQSVSIVKVTFPAKYEQSLYVDKAGRVRVDDGGEGVEAGELCVDERTRNVIKKSSHSTAASRFFSSFTKRVLGIASYDRETGCNAKGRRLTAYHHTGGNAVGVLRDDYSVLGVSNLFVADASITQGHIFGAPTTNIFAYGYAVADKFPVDT